MADLASAPDIIFRGFTAADYDRQNQMQASTAGIGLDNQIRQQQIDQGKYDLNARKILDDLIQKNTKLQQPEQPMTPEQVAAQGGSPAMPTGTSPTGRPTLATPPEQNAPAPQAPAAPPDVQMGSGALPGPGGVGWGSGQPIRQISPNATPQDRPSVGGMMGPTELPGTPAAPAAPDRAAPASAPAQPANPYSGKWVTDWGAIQNGLVSAGYGSKALAMNPQLQKALTDAVDYHIKQADLASKQNQQIAQLVGTIPLVDTSITDPVALQAAKDNFTAAAQNVIRRGLQSGVIDQQHEQGLIQAVQGGWTPQLQQQVQQISDMASTVSQQHTEHREDLKDKREALRTGGEIEKNTAETIQKQLGNSAQTVGAVTDQASLDSWYQRQPKAVQDAVADVYKKGYSGETVDALKAMGQTEEQKAVLAARKEGQDAMNDIRQQNADTRREIAEFHRQQSGKESAADRVDQRQAQRSLLTLQQKEEPLYGQIAQLQSAIRNGNVFVGKNGTPVPMDTANKGDEKASEALIEDMKDRMEGMKQQAHALIDEKYDIVEQHGGTPNVSRQQAHAGVGKEATPKPATAPAADPAARTAPAPKPAATAPAAGQKQWKDAKGTTWSMNQTVTGPDNKQYVITGFKDGKILTKPQGSQSAQGQ